MVTPQGREPKWRTPQMHPTRRADWLRTWRECRLQSFPSPPRSLPARLLPSLFLVALFFLLLL